MTNTKTYTNAPSVRAELVPDKVIRDTAKILYDILLRTEQAERERSVANER